MGLRTIADAKVYRPLRWTHIESPAGYSTGIAADKNTVVRGSNFHVGRLLDVHRTPEAARVDAGAALAQAPLLAKKYTKIYHFNSGFVAAFQ